MTAPQAGRPRWWVAGLSLVVVAAVALGLWSTRSESPYRAPLTGPGPAQASPDQARALLDALVHAVRRGDGRAAARLGDTGAWSDLRGVAANAPRLHVTDLSLRYVDQAGAVSAQGAWSADVHASWRFAGFDQRPESVEVRVGFAPAGGLPGTPLRITRIGGGDRRSPLWLTGAVRVRRGPATLVLVAGSSREADHYARLADRAVPQVRETLPGWRGGLVVEVPRTAAGLRRSLDAGPEEYAGIAAVTTTVDGTGSRRQPVHVFVNPAVLGPLRPRGAQVVLTHEATHVAVGAASSTAPTWLVEGFADYVALRAVPVPLRTAAARVIALVRRDGVPAHLPGDGEFAHGATGLEAHYESAWLACRVLAATAGPRGLVAFYRAVDHGAPVTAAMRREVGLGPASLLGRWQRLLSDLAA